MDNEHPQLDALMATLEDWKSRWAQRVQEATRQSQQISVQSVHQSYYYRGIAEGLKLALRDLETLFPTSESTHNPNPHLIPEVFAEVDHATAMVLLQQVGLSVTELQQHNDHSFSAIFSSIQLNSLDDRAAKLRQSTDVVVLAQGRLPNSSKSYIDFAFRSVPPL